MVRLSPSLLPVLQALDRLCAFPFGMTQNDLASRSPTADADENGYGSRSRSTLDTFAVHAEPKECP